MDSHKKERSHFQLNIGLEVMMCASHHEAAALEA
jgi:hypothetical protein